MFTLCFLMTEHSTTISLNPEPCSAGRAGAAAPRVRRRRGDAQAETVPMADQAKTTAAGASKAAEPDDWNQPLSEDW